MKSTADNITTIRNQLALAHKGLRELKLDKYKRVRVGGAYRSSAMSHLQCAQKDMEMLSEMYLK